jgi:S1-C subfamily serine protease
MTERPRRGSAPEVRLLLATITISAIVLLLLARVRFPQTTPTPQLPVTPPLERLAARATYDELAGIVGDAQKRLAASLLTVRLRREPPHGVPLDARELSGVPAPSRLATAIRLDDELALTYLAPGTVPDRLLPQGEAASMVAIDEINGLALLKVPDGPVVVPMPATTPIIEVPAYVAGAEATLAGAALTPLFVARADAARDSQWNTVLYALGIAATPPGTPLFSLTGEFMGLVVPAADGTALLTAQDVMRHVSRLRENGTVRRAHLGFSVQPLSPQLASATGTTGGVVVVLVEGDGPAREVLRVGDVIELVNDTAAPDVDTFVTLVSTLQAGSAVRLGVVRGGARSRITLTTAPSDAKMAADALALGLALRTLRGIGAEVVTVAPGTVASRAGVRAGDIVTHLDGEPQPTADQIERAWAARRPPLVLGIRRGVQPLVLALTAS